MALTYPTPIDTQGAISRGSGRLYWGVYNSAGGDTVTSPVKDLGPTLNGLELDLKRGFHKIMADQYLGPIGGFPISEDVEFKTTLLYDHLALHYDAWATSGAYNTNGSVGNETYPANVLTAGTLTGTYPSGSVAGSLSFGESFSRRYVQLIWKGPGPGDTLTRTVQLWKCTATAIGAIKYEKGKERTLQITWTAFADPVNQQIAGNGAVGKMIDA